MLTLIVIRICRCCRSCLWHLGETAAAAAIKWQLQERVEPSHVRIWKISLILGPETHVTCWGMGNVFFFLLVINAVAFLSVTMSV